MAENLSTEWDSKIADLDATTIEPAPDDTSEDPAAGWNTDKSDGPKTTWTSNNQISATHYLAAFEDWYGKEIARSTHLCIKSADSKGTSEIAGLDDMSSGFDLTTSLVFDREQSCVEIEARFVRENSSMSPQYQKMFVRFYVDSVEDLEYLTCTSVDNVDQLPPGLANISRAVKYCKRNELWVLDLEYIKTKIVTEGLDDNLDFADPAKLHAVDVLRQLRAVTEVSLFVRLTSILFFKTLDLLKKKMRYELFSPPFSEYIAKSGNYVLQWNNHQFSSDRDTFPRRFRNTFRDIDHHRLTHGYGVIRDSTPQLKHALDTLATSMTASFVILPGRRAVNDLPVHYLAFVQCDSEELIRQLYPVGESGTFCFDEPAPNLKPVGWQYTIKPPIPNFQYPGNLIFQLKRRRGDQRKVPVSPFPQPDMPQQEIWAFPNASDLAPRRLVNCANLTKQLGPDADEMRRYICALDLREKERGHGLFDNLSESQTQVINKLLSQLSPSQLGAFEHVKHTKHDVVLIQGPPGTGKTTFIVTLLQILFHLNHKWIACAPSNSATDHLATVLEQKCPEMGAIRFHTYENETQAVRREERELAPDNTEEEIRPDEDAPDAETAEDSRIFYSYMTELQEKDQEWKGTKLGRPNFKNMGLHVRAMQNAGVVQHQLNCFAPQSDDPHADFRAALKNRDFGKDRTDAEKQAYKILEDNLMVDTIRKTCGLITTLSKTADNKMREAKKPVVAIIDEACQSTELESLLVWAHNTETLLLLIFLGDPKQLRATVKTYNQNTDEQMVNPFAEQMVISLFERLWRRGFSTYMFTEQYRLAAGLEEVFNEQFYNNKITNAECTKVENRPGAQKAIDFIKEKYNLCDGIPHICLNVPSGVCLRSQLKSRYNLHNIITIINAINKMLTEKLWTESEITVITPYREQAARYRQVFRRQKWFDIQVFTVDSVQGRENKCTIFDTVLAYTRLGGWGFVKDGLRLNVAVSRSIEHFIFVCDLTALNDTAQHRKDLDEMEFEDREARERTEREISKSLRGVFNYFQRKGMVYLSNPESLPEMSLVDMTPVTEFRRRNACRNCMQEGHRSTECPNPRVFNGTCRNCQQQGHMSSQCPQPRIFNGTCRNCHQAGHRKTNCPTVTCGNCKNKGHTSAICEEPDRRTCNNCKKAGHVSKDCPEPRKGSRLPFTVPGVSTNVGGDVEPEPTEAPAPQLTVPDAWQEFEGEDNTLDPNEVARELARDNEPLTGAADGSNAGGEDEEDEEENEGDGVEAFFGEDDGRQTGVRLQ